MVFLVLFGLSTYLFPNGFDQDEIRERNAHDERASINVTTLRSLRTRHVFSPLIFWQSISIPFVSRLSLLSIFHRSKLSRN